MLVLAPSKHPITGNITERAPDTMIRQILAACGHVLSWKKVKAFGFCELAGPDAGLRAVRLLHDLMVHDKRLVAKVDAKTQTVLDEYKGWCNCAVPSCGLCLFALLLLKLSARKSRNLHLCKMSQRMNLTRRPNIWMLFPKSESSRF